MPTKTDFERFKEDYPEVYTKWLEINRALAKIQRKLMSSEPRHKQNTSSIPEATDEYDPNFLELD